MIRLLFVGAFYYLCFVYLGIKGNLSYGFEGNDVISVSMIKPFFIIIFTLLGIYSSIIYDATNKVSKSVKASESKTVIQIIKSIRATEVLKGFLVAPLVLLAFYSSVEQINNIILVMLISYQNGFFWKSIVGGKFK